MASYTGASSQHQTLAASTVDTVTLTADFNAVEVLNRGTSGDIYFTVDGVTVPTVGGAGTYVVQPGMSLIVDPATSANTVVKLISSGTPAYSVTGI